MTVLMQVMWVMVLVGSTFFIFTTNPTTQILEECLHNFNYYWFLNQFHSSKILSVNTLVAGIATFISSR